MRLQREDLPPRAPVHEAVIGTLDVHVPPAVKQRGLQ